MHYTVSLGKTLTRETQKKRKEKKREERKKGKKEGERERNFTWLQLVALGNAIAEHTQTRAHACMHARRSNWIEL